jgi:hypothetical protein
MEWAMNVTAVTDFEVYLLMTMKPRLSLADTRGLLDARLSRIGASLDDAVRIHERTAAALTEEASRFRDMKALLGIPEDGATSLITTVCCGPGFASPPVLTNTGYSSQHVTRTPSAHRSMSNLRFNWPLERRHSSI